MAFEKATKKKSKLKLLITGPSGSGKTMTALLIARGLVGPTGKIAVIDTENRSSTLYAGTTTDFDVDDINAPFTVDKYTKSIKDAIRGGYDAVIVDSISHEWTGAGGLLAQKEALDAIPRGNSYTNWATITKQHEAFKELIQQADIHLIATARSKQDYILMEKFGKQVPTKVGMAPMQRDGVEYEFTLVLDMSMAHNADVSKDRTMLFDGTVFVPTNETGEQLKVWLDSGADEPKNEHHEAEIKAACEAHAPSTETKPDIPTLKTNPVIFEDETPKNQDNYLALVETMKGITAITGEEALSVLKRTISSTYESWSEATEEECKDANETLSKELVSMQAQAQAPAKVKPTAKERIAAVMDTIPAEHRNELTALIQLYAQKQVPKITPNTLAVTLEDLQRDSQGVVGVLITEIKDRFDLSYKKTQGEPA